MSLEANPAEWRYLDDCDNGAVTILDGHAENRVCVVARALVESTIEKWVLAGIRNINCLARASNQAGYAFANGNANTGCISRDCEDQFLQQQESQRA